MQKEGITLFISKHSAGAAAVSEWLHGKAVGGGTRAQLSAFPYGALSVRPSILTYSGQVGVECWKRSCSAAALRCASTGLMKGHQKRGMVSLKPERVQNTWVVKMSTSTDLELSSETDYKKAALVFHL